MAGPRVDEPILASWKISQVLKQYPNLLDELVGLSPAFEKLRNPAIRKVQTRLVTVAQAARIAGIDPAELTLRLNRAAGIAPADDTAAPASAPGDEHQEPPRIPGWVGTAPVETELDVRPVLARGEEPFPAIVSAARGIPPGSAFRLIVGFEPVPLYDALAKQGFDHWAAQRDDTWEVLFYRRPDEQQSDSTPKTRATDSAVLDWDSPAGAEITIDVSELVPPEPMIKILQTLETLPPNGRLLVHHVRRPIHLYERLNEMGYAHETRETGTGRVEVLIQKRPGATDRP